MRICSRALSRVIFGYYCAVPSPLHPDSINIAKLTPERLLVYISVIFQCDLLRRESMLFVSQQYPIGRRHSKAITYRTTTPFYCKILNAVQDAVVCLNSLQSRYEDLEQNRIKNRGLSLQERRCAMQRRLDRMKEFMGNIGLTVGG